MGRSKYDWAAIRASYVQGEKDLREFSRESTKLEASPKYQTILNRASRENWSKQREEFQAGSAKVVMQTQELLDMASAIHQHIQLAQGLQTSVSLVLEKLLPAIENIDWQRLGVSQISSLLKTVASVTEIATTIERKAIGLADPTSISIGLNISSLSDEELSQYEFLIAKMGHSDESGSEYRGNYSHN